MARARKVSHQAVEHYAQQHPGATQTEIGRVFSITQGSVGRILRRVGLTNTHRGVPRKETTLPRGTRFDRFGKVCPMQSQSPEVQYFYWDRFLQQLGCGMSRGERLGRQRLLYGYDNSRQAVQDESATLPEELDDCDPAVEAFSRETEGITEPLEESPMALACSQPESTDFEDQCLSNL
jgi:hypothetical protein